MPSIIENASAITNRYSGVKAKLDKHAIHIQVENPDGFSFSLVDDETEISLYFCNWHCPFSEEEEALRAFEKCLSGEAQLREITSLGLPYKGWLEVYEGKSQEAGMYYETGLITVLFLFPFPKKERRYRNAFTKAA
jgi:hypothetical protein